MSAKPLEWIDGWYYHEAVTFDGSKYLITPCTVEGVSSWRLESKSLGNKCLTFDTLDAAKAHAEQLHQQAWSEMKRKWEA